MDLFEDIHKMKMDFPKKNAITSEISTYKFNFYQIFETLYINTFSCLLNIRKIKKSFIFHIKMVNSIISSEKIFLNCFVIFVF